MNRTRINLALLLTLSAAGAILCGAGAANAGDLSGKGDSFLSRRAAGASKGGWSQVIVRFADDLNPAQQKQLKALGADTYRHLPIIHSDALSVPTRNLEKLAALPFVKHLSADIDVKKSDEFTVESSGADVAFSQWKLDGTGVGVAVIDSGSVDSADLSVKGAQSSRLLTGIDFVPVTTVKGKKSAAGGDPCGHGTHVAGIIGGNGTNSTGVSCYRTFFGVARNANIIPVRVLDADGQGTVSQVISGIQWAVANKAAYNVRVMNLSLGHPVGESYTTDPLCQAVESAWKAGIVVVCSAGNDGRLNSAVTAGVSNEGYDTAYGSIQSPGNDPYVITVGAMKAMDFAFKTDGTHSHTRSNDKIATYSSRGPSRLDLVLKPDIIAPGNKVISLNYQNSYLSTNFGATNIVVNSDYVNTNHGQGKKASPDYLRLSGTSMAAPVVSGAAALMLQANPSLSPDTIKARLMLSADKWTQPDGTADVCTFGAGYLNIPAALQCPAVPNQAALSPSLCIDGDNNVTINMDRAIWGHALDGSSAIWGVNGINDLRAIWGHTAFADSTANLLSSSRAIWGHSVTAERAIWGHCVWEDRAIWGHAIEGVDLTSTAINGE
jgi:serine protease AprX